VLATVEPAAVGTHSFTRKIGADYTAGRSYVGAALDLCFRETDVLAVDIETFGVGIEGRRIKSVSFGTARHAVVMDPRDPIQADLIRRAFDNARILVIHNSVFDVPSLYLNGLLEMRHINKVVDTIIYGRLAQPSDIGGHDLYAAGKHYCGLEGDNYLKRAFAMLGMAAETGWREFDIDRIIYLQGAAADVIVTARLYPVIRQAAYDQTTKGHPFINHGVTGDEAWRLVDREQIVNRVLLRRTCKGIVADLEYLDKYRADNFALIQEAERELEKLGIQPENSDDLIRWMVDNNQLPESYPRVGKTNKLSGQAKHIETLSHPVAKLFVDHKKVKKIDKDYLQKCVDLSIKGEDGNYRVFPVTSVLKAATGRAAMADPPLHQFNGPARGILLPDPGDTFVSADWSAIEPCVVANMAGEVGMYTHYETWYPDQKNRDTGELGTFGDMYEGVAALAGIKRKEAKVTLLAQLYGEGIPKLALDLGVTEETAKGYKMSIFDGIPRVRHFIETLKRIAREHQKIMTISGRIIPVPSAIFDGQWTVSAHRGVNYTVQGSAYDVLAETIVRAEEQGLGDGIYFTMHDEIIMSKDAAEDIRKIMETPPERLCRMSGRTPKLRTDMAEIDRWASV
jgi:DNA polymerase-1